jgi:3-oxoacyl-[acyl-carrier protein] reductase
MQLSLSGQLSGRNALVAGSTQGIGKATALELARMGANVTLVARNIDKLQTTLALLDTSAGQQHGYLVADFSQPEQLRQTLASETGKGRVWHILINNTGGPAGGPILNATPEAFFTAYDQHLICNHLLAQALVPGMKAAGWGRIVNIISTSVKAPLENLGVSNTTRGAVANWAKTLAGEVGPFCITVNNVLPGFTATERLQEIIRSKMAETGQDEATIRANMAKAVPLRRIAGPEEVAAAVCFLASPAASYITGINVPVDGGRTQSL